jgi:hypothetical protein
MLIKEAGQDVHRDVGTGESGFHILTGYWFVALVGASHG